MNITLRRQPVQSRFFPLPKKRKKKRAFDVLNGTPRAFLPYHEPSVLDSVPRVNGSVFHNTLNIQEVERQYEKREAYAGRGREPATPERGESKQAEMKRERRPNNTPSRAMQAAQGLGRAAVAATPYARSAISSTANLAVSGAQMLASGIGALIAQAGGSPSNEPDGEGSYLNELGEVRYNLDLYNVDFVPEPREEPEGYEDFDDEPVFQGSANPGMQPAATSQTMDLSEDRSSFYNPQGTSLAGQYNEFGNRSSSRDSNPVDRFVP